MYPDGKLQSYNCWKRILRIGMLKETPAIIARRTSTPPDVAPSIAGVFLIRPPAPRRKSNNATCMRQGTKSQSMLT